MRVRAIDTGYYKGLRKAGDEFEVPDGTQLGSWLMKVEAPAPAPKPSKSKKQSSLTP